MNRRPLAIVFTLVTALLILCSSKPAHAQLKWDASLEVGAQRHWLSSGVDANLGPTADVRAHLGIIPLVRAGLYLSHDISSLVGGIYNDEPYRHFTAGGLEAKISAPLNLGDTKLSLLVGVGYVYAYRRSYSMSLISPGSGSSQPVNVLFAGLSGDYAEIPLGLHVDYKLRKPFVLSATAGAKFGFAFGDNLYRRSQFATAGGAGQFSPGNDVATLFLTIGMGFDL